MQDSVQEVFLALTMVYARYHHIELNSAHLTVPVQWRERYPNARSYGCPGLSEKMPEVGFDMEVGSSGREPEEWLGEVQSTWLSYEHNPFTRKSFFSEVGPLQA